MKKIWKVAIGIALSAAMCASFAACGKNDTAQDDRIAAYEMYVAYAETIGDDVLSYEEWLDSIRGKDGVDGKDGLTPSIGENGNWWLGDTDTGVKAQGADGKDGKDGVDGQDGKDGIDGQDGENGKDLTAQEVTLTFDVNGGDPLAEDTITLSKGDSVDLPVPTRKGYNFLGWFYGTGVNAGQVTDVTPISRDMTVVAHWEYDPNWTPDETPTEFVSPIEGGKILTKHRDAYYNSTLGWSYFHSGVDIEAQVGDVVRCMADGVVESITYDEVKGNSVVISHGDGLKSVYIYINPDAELKVGDIVDMGDVIGTVTALPEGAGNYEHEFAEEAHLHFQVLLEEKSVDPLDYIPYEETEEE